MWAGGPDDQERRRNRRDDALDFVDWLIDDGPALDLSKSALDHVNEAAGLWKWNAKHYGLEHLDPKTDAEAFASPQWGPLLQHLRALGLPMQRIRSLARGRTDGGPFESLCVCDADEDGNLQPYRITVVPCAVSMPDLVCDHRASRGGVPDQAAWLPPGDVLRKTVVSRRSEPVIKEGGRFTGNFVGRAIARKVNEALDGSRWVTVWAEDAGTAEAVGEVALDEASNAIKSVWMVRGGQFIHADRTLTAGAPGRSPTGPPHTDRLLDLQRKYAERVQQHLPGPLESRCRGLAPEG